MAKRKFKLEDFSQLELDDANGQLFFKGKAIEYRRTIRFGALGNFVGLCIAFLSLSSPMFYFWAENEKITAYFCSKNRNIIFSKIGEYLVTCEPPISLDNKTPPTFHCHRAK